MGLTLRNSCFTDVWAGDKVDMPVVSHTGQIGEEVTPTSLEVSSDMHHCMLQGGETGEGSGNGFETSWWVPASLPLSPRPSPPI